MSDVEERAQNGTSSNLMEYGTWACCIVMILPVFAYFAAVDLTVGKTNNIFTLAPLLLCVGAHVALHRFMVETRPWNLEGYGCRCHKSAGSHRPGYCNWVIPSRAAHHLSACCADARPFAWGVCSLDQALSSARQRRAVHEGHVCPSSDELQRKGRPSNWAQSF